MNPRFEVVEGRLHHCGQLIHRMRTEHFEALTAFGINHKLAHKALVESFNASSFRRAWLIDGKIAGLGGVHGMMASSTGFIWMVLTQEATKYPVSVIKEARKQIEEIMLTRCQLNTSIITRDVTALRFAEYMGFRAGEYVQGREITHMIYAKDED